MLKNVGDTNLPLESADKGKKYSKFLIGLSVIGIIKIVICLLCHLGLNSDIIYNNAIVRDAVIIPIIEFYLVTGGVTFYCGSLGVVLVAVIVYNVIKIKKKSQTATDISLSFGCILLWIIALITQVILVKNAF